MYWNRRSSSSAQAFPEWAYTWRDKNKWQIQQECYLHRCEIVQTCKIPVHFTRFKHENHKLCKCIFYPIDVYAQNSQTFSAKVDIRLLYMFAGSTSWDMKPTLPSTLSEDSWLVGMTYVCLNWIILVGHIQWQAYFTFLKAMWCSILLPEFYCAYTSCWYRHCVFFHQNLFSWVFLDSEIYMHA